MEEAEKRGVQKGGIKMWISRKQWKALEERVDELERKSKRTSTPLQEIKRALKEALQETKPSPVLFDD